MCIDFFNQCVKVVFPKGFNNLQWDDSRTKILVTTFNMAINNR